ncbi:WYL domain-containing protein [Helicobacter burdigaliensis]|uniref:WYL domain-containing protein n=1 Tax=Helicobacter burdigaliensis TaxID=2315334 RepID=UPI000EF7461D|nr:WYL domain-containing protein [Helicobacter burdigaliensis]
MQKIENQKIKRLKYICSKISQVPCSIKELSLELKVSTKTIKRDLESLKAIKVGNKWKIEVDILESFYKNFIHLEALEDAFKLPKTSQKSIFIHWEAEKLSNEDLKNFRILERAIKEKKEVDFEFRGISFTLKPLKLAFFSEFWYLLGLDSAKEDKFKKFYFKDIKNIKIGKNSFSTQIPLEEILKNADSIWFSEDCFSVRLFIEVPIVKYFLRKPLRSQKILGKDKDGSLEIEVQVSNEMEILPLIYSYIPYIKVLEPRSLQESIKQTLKSYLKEIK